MADEDLHEIGIAGSAQEQVLKLAKLAQEAGVGGLVASPSELEALRQTIGEQMKIVTPGGSRPGAAATKATKREWRRQQRLLRMELTTSWWEGLSPGPSSGSRQQKQLEDI